MKEAIIEIPRRTKMRISKAFIRTGPVLLNSVVNVPITLIPTNWIFSGARKKKCGSGNIMTINTFTEHPHLQINRILDLPKVIYQYMIRLFFV